MSRIPPEAAVSTTERLVAQLAARREIHIFPVGAGRSEYVLEREAAIARASLPDHALAARAGGWVLLKRRG